MCVYINGICSSPEQRQPAAVAAEHMGGRGMSCYLRLTAQSRRLLLGKCKRAVRAGDAGIRVCVETFTGGLAGCMH